MDANETVYTGLWIDHSQGRVLGATLTLSPRDAPVLNAFLAVLLSFAGTQLWKILAYVIHQVVYRKVYTNALEHQQRVLLRNTNNPGPMTWALFLQCISWRKPFRTLPLAVFALLYMIAAAALSIFVPSHVHAGPVRLLVPNNCGTPNVGNLAPTEFSTLSLKRAQEGSLHSQNCYETSSGSVCEGFPVLKTNFTTNVTCPFPNMCYQADGAVPIRMETPMLHSRDDMGIDLSEHVEFSTSLTCSLITRSNFTKITEHGADAGNANLVSYMYGPLAESIDNNTFDYNVLLASYVPSYGINVVYSTPGNNDSTWFPIPELNRTDADVTLLFVQSNAVWSDVPILDPMFKSVDHPVLVNAQNQTTTYTEYYESAFYGSIVGCAGQYQVCNPDNGACTTPGAFSNTFTLGQAVKIGLTSIQYEITSRIAIAAVWNQLSSVIGTRSDHALRATSTVQSKIQLGLPSDQYLIEMKSWFTTGLSMWQSAVRSWATTDDSSVKLPLSATNQVMCSTQRTLDVAGTVSFSLLGLVLVVVLCAIVIVISYILEPLVSWMLSRGTAKMRTAPALWKVDDVLQIQRRLFEALGYTRFSSEAWVPTSATNQAFGEMNFRHFKDPRFIEQVDSSQPVFDSSDKKATVNAWELSSLRPDESSAYRPYQRETME